MDTYSDEILSKYYGNPPTEVDDIIRSLVRTYRPFYVYTISSGEVHEIPGDNSDESFMFNLSWEGCIKYIIDNKLEDVRVSPVYLYG